MTYVYIRNGEVYELIPEINPIFPGVPISERYTAEFLKDCVAVEDAEGLEQGMIYDAVSGSFSKAPEAADDGGEEEI